LLLQRLWTPGAQEVQPDLFFTQMQLLHFPILPLQLQHLFKRVGCELLRELAINYVKRSDIGKMREKDEKAECTENLIFGLLTIKTKAKVTQGHFEKRMYR